MNMGALELQHEQDSSVLVEACLTENKVGCSIVSYSSEV